MSHARVELRCGSDLELELSTVMAICKVIDTPRSLTVYLLCKYSEFDQLVGLECSAADYEDHRNFADDYLVTDLLRKSPTLPTSFNRKQVAIDSFFESEDQCKRTNDRLMRNQLPSWFFDFRNQVFKILGPLTYKDTVRISERFSFGPGATTGVRGTGSSLSDKFSAEMHLTDKLIPFVRSIMGELWWEHQRSYKVVEGSKFTTVPKTAKTDRGICIEPTLNIYVQKGIGAVIREKLKRFGVNLNDQTRNQELARRAWKDDLSTIDLSAASDSISSCLVLQCLPPRWFDLLELARCDYTNIDGKFVELEKFSSMGNGYTFELESLLFYSLIRTIVPIHELTEVSVYGDDLILPSKYAGLLIDRLEFLGFKVNGRKSFLAGNFFESCGADWFKGRNVRPFHLKGSSEVSLPYTLQIANKLRIYSHLTNHIGCDLRWKPLWTALKRAIPKAWRSTRVPLSLGDLGLIVDESEALHLKRPRDGWEGRLAVVVIQSNKFRRRRNIFRLLAAYAWQANRQSDHQFSLWEKGSPFTYGREPIRGLYGKPKTKRIPVIWDPVGLYWV